MPVRPDVTRTRSRGAMFAASRPNARLAGSLARAMLVSVLVALGLSPARAQGTVPTDSLSVDVLDDTPGIYLPIALAQAKLEHAAHTALPVTGTPTLSPGSSTSPPSTAAPGTPTPTPTPAGGTDDPPPPTLEPSVTPGPTDEPLPTPLPEDDKPWAALLFGDASHRARLGTHCWSIACVDYIGLMTPVQPITIVQGMTVTLRIGLAPTSMSLDFYPVVPGPDGGDEVASGDDWRAWRPRSEPITVPVTAVAEQEVEMPSAPGLYVMSISAGWDGSGPGGHFGDAQLGFLVEVADASPMPGAFGRPAARWAESGLQ